MQWQLIETAPRDGTVVVVYFQVAGVEVVHLARFNSVEDWERSGKFCACDGETIDGYVGWWAYTRNSVTEEKLDGWRTPTHWVPYQSPGGV